MSTASSLLSGKTYIIYLPTAKSPWSCRPRRLRRRRRYDNISAMRRQHAAIPRNILVSFDISSIAGRDQLSGVLRYLRSRPQWTPRLVANPVDFTPALVRGARSAHVDGIIVNPPVAEVRHRVYPQRQRRDGPHRGAVLPLARQLQIVRLHTGGAFRRRMVYRQGIRLPDGTQPLWAQAFGLPGRGRCGGVAARTRRMARHPPEAGRRVCGMGLSGDAGA